MWEMADLLTNSLRASRTFPELVSSKICKVYPLEGLRPPTVALGVLVVSITSCSESPGVGLGRAVETSKVCARACVCAHLCVHVCVCQGLVKSSRLLVLHTHCPAWAPRPHQALGTLGCRCVSINCADTHPICPEACHSLFRTLSSPIPPPTPHLLRAGHRLCTVRALDTKTKSYSHVPRALL